LGVKAAPSEKRGPRRWPVSGLAERFHRLPRRLFDAPSGCVMEAGGRKARLPFRDRCGGSAGEVRRYRHSFLLPVELRHVNHTASTNALILRPAFVTKPYNRSRMASAPQIEQIAERVERLLVRYEELQRTNALLAQQVEVLTTERDSLKSRLAAARARVDALLERLPIAS
jgi:hypothetical protein